jgi:RNA polymerase sigma factor (sigma-70 family)
MPGGFSHHGLPSTVSDALGRLLAWGLTRGSISAKRLEKILMSQAVDPGDLDLFLQLSGDFQIPIVPTNRGNGDSLPSKGSAGSNGKRKPEVRGDNPPGLDLYFEALRAYPPVAASRERALMRRVRKGSESARKEMICSNLRLVVYHARRYRGRGVGLDDLIEEGNLGLFRAVERFDPERGFRFSTYASWWIRHALGQAVAHFGRTVRLPLDLLRRLHQLLEAERVLTQVLGRRPTEEELAQRMKRSLRQVRRLLSLRDGTFSLDSPVSPDSEGETFMRNLPSPDNLERIVEGHLQKAEVDVWLRELPAMDELILRARFGFLDGRPHTLAEVSRQVGRSRERVRQLEKRALLLLRAKALAPFRALRENPPGGSQGFVPEACCKAC